MYNGRNTPWEQYPKNLKFIEIQAPLRVLEDFFSAGLPKRHCKNLKEWRRYVTKDEHYINEREGPGTLLFHYDLIVKFMEAMHLLLCGYREISWNFKKATQEQIADERTSWEYFPKGLSETVLANPYILVKKCFKSFKPQDYRDHLKEWLHTALYNHAIEETLTPGDVIQVYENLIMLFAAGWLIYQREGDKPYLKRSGNQNEDLNKVVSDEVELIRPLC